MPWSKTPPPASPEPARHSPEAKPTRLPLRGPSSCQAERGGQGTSGQVADGESDGGQGWYPEYIAIAHPGLLLSGASRPSAFTLGFPKAIQ